MSKIRDKENNNFVNRQQVTFFIHTLGCRVNQYESDAIAQALKNNGWFEIKTSEELECKRPNVAIVHTCAVTQEAARKSGQLIRRMRNRFDADMVVAIGCHVEVMHGKTAADLSLGNKDKNKAADFIIESYAEYLRDKASEVNGENFDNNQDDYRLDDFKIYADDQNSDLVKDKACTCGKYEDHCHCSSCDCTESSMDNITNHKPESVNVGNIERVRFSPIIREETLVCNLPEQHRGQDISFSDMGSVYRQRGTRAYIKIQDGCDMKCSYCTINKARGASRSRDFSSIIEEAKLLASRGYKDIVLTGIEVSAYGYDFKKLENAKGLHLIDLIEALDKIDGVSRILLASLDPRVASLDFVQRAAKLNNFGAHFHLSLQSGSDSVLKRMRRAYNSNFYHEAVKRIYSYFPKANITTDLITGFPGETEEEHLESLDFCKKQEFCDFHVFPYSDRPGTEASLMPNKVDKNVAKRRLHEFEKLRDELWQRRADLELNEIHELLVEQVNENGAIGYTKNYLPICVPNAKDSSLVGEIVKVLITGRDANLLLAELC